MTNYEEFNTQIQNIEGKKHVIEEDIKNLKQIVVELEVNFDNAIVEDKPVTQIIKHIEGIKKEIQDQERKKQAYNKTDMSKNESLKDRGELVLRENAKDIETSKEEYKIKSKELAEIKSKFLKVVAELGLIKQISDAKSNEMTRVTKFLTGKMQYYPTIETDINDLNQTGHVYITKQESTNAYKK